MTQDAFFNIGDELFFYDDKTGDVEKVLVKDIRYTKHLYPNDIAYLITHINRENNPSLFISQARLVQIASRSKAGLVGHIISKLEDKIEAWNKTIESCQRELQEVKDIQANIQNTITKLKQEN